MSKKIEADLALIEKESGLAKLVGARLSSVQFVLDYLILGFDERGALTTLVWPELFQKGSRLAFGMDQYRNELCSLIECRTTDVGIDRDEIIRIRFDNGTELKIALRSYAAHGERAILTGPNHFLLVF